MKKVIWIDDSICMMDSVVKNLFGELWSKDCCNRMIFAGNNYKEGESKNFEITGTNKKMLTNDMLKYFALYCAENAVSGKKPMDVWKEKKGLRPAESYYIDATDQGEVKKEILEFIKKDEKEKLYDKIFICLDIRLFEDDEKHKEKKKKTLAMELFYELSEDKTSDGQKKYSVFLYSSYTSYDDVIPYWIKRFSEYYTDFKGEIYIFDRYELVSRNDKSEERGKFLKLFETKNDV